MDARFAAGVVALTGGLILNGGPEASQSRPATDGPASGSTPAWFLQGSFPDPTGRTIVDASGRVTVPPRGDSGRGAASAAPAGAMANETPACRRSPLCGNRLGRARPSLQRVQWKQTLGYTFAYPYALPPGFGGVPAVALDSKGHLWAFQRADAGKPQLFKFDPSAQTDPAGRPRRDRLPGQGARDGGRC